MGDIPETNERYYNINSLDRSLLMKQFVIQETHTQRIKTKNVVSTSVPTDNATKTMQKLNEMSHETLPHPPHSPDLSPLDYRFFEHFDNFLREKRFINDGGVPLTMPGHILQRALQKLNELSPKLCFSHRTLQTIHPLIIAFSGISTFARERNAPPTTDVSHCQFLAAWHKGLCRS